MLWYIFKLCVIVLVVLPVYLLIRRPWKEKSVRAWAETAFMVFMAGLMALVLEGEYRNPIRMAETAAERIAAGEGINLIPFRTIGSFFRHFVLDDFMINVVGNIVMFIPWGFGLVLLWKRKQTFWSVVLHSFLLPVFIETSQLFIGRNVDVDDLILNFAGGCLGAGLYFVLRKAVPGMEKLAR